MWERTAGRGCVLQRRDTTWRPDGEEAEKYSDLFLLSSGFPSALLIDGTQLEARGQGSLDVVHNGQSPGGQSAAEEWRVDQKGQIGKIQYSGLHNTSYELYEHITCRATHAA